jgi:hypothetical protein
LQWTPLPVNFIFADVMHIHTQPVAGAVHIELFLAFRFEYRLNRTLAQFKVDETLR